MYRRATGMALPPPLAHDGNFGGIRSGGRGCEAAAEGVCAVEGGIEPAARAELFYSFRNDPRGEASAADPSCAIDPPEDGTFLKVGDCEPMAQALHRTGRRISSGEDGHFFEIAFLIRFGATEPEDEAVGFEAEVGEVQADELAASEGAGEAE